MKFVKCDRCDVVKKHMNTFNFPIHIFDENPCYVDSEMNEISGRFETIDLCNKCYNIVMRSAFKSYKEGKDND